MSRLLRLYPPAWRERYEAEFEALLQERPIRWRGSIDLLLGAIDARLHPELFGTTRQPWTHRLPGFLATTAGLLWTGYFVRLLTLRPNEEWGESIGFAVLLMFVVVPGDYTLPYLKRIGIITGAIVIAMVLGRILPWNVADGLLNLTAGITAWLLVGAGMLTLAAIRAQVGARGRWVLLGAAVLLPAIVGIPILGGFGSGGAGGMVATFIALMPYGLAWTFLGLRMIARGSATIFETPSSPRATEVLAT